MLDEQLTTMASLSAANISDEFECEMCGEKSPCAVDPSLYEFILEGVILNVVNMLGIVCNTISIYILSRKQMRASINCCLIGLATFDILLLVCSIFVWGLPAISQYSGGMRSLTSRIIPHMTPWLYPLATIAHTGSTYVTVTVTVERYVAVCHSLKARYICTYGRARLYMILISIFVVVYNVPKFLETEVQPIVNIRENRTIVGYIACPTPLRNERTYIEVYIMWMYFIVMYCIPFGTLVILNSLIYRNVRIANRMRQLLSRRQQKEIGLATMLFAIVLLFMVCNSLSFVINIIELMNSDSKIIEEAGMERIADFSNLLININSSSNFVIYCIFGQKFRRLFLRLFCERLLRRRCGTLGCAEDMSMAGPTADASSVPMKRMYRGSNATETENGEDHRLLVASRGSHYSPVSMTTLSVNLPTSTTSVSGV
ncbi:FMRFamide receptor-like [Amphibalanus amphitrite]|uniref:FMRFamide receptor-like n=1 Tax=Amphibalanus amphitrite TaxID=1232801 RepID=UPI001C9078A3|nr:FMRFamide receptor-like [Amphibalanus amphitrite]